MGIEKKQIDNKKNVNRKQKRNGSKSVLRNLQMRVFSFYHSLAVEKDHFMSDSLFVGSESLSLSLSLNKHIQIPKNHSLSTTYLLITTQYLQRRSRVFVIPTTQQIVNQSKERRPILLHPGNPNFFFLKIISILLL